MQVFDEVNKEWIDKVDSVKIVVKYKNNQIIFGYTNYKNILVKIFIKINDSIRVFLTSLDIFKGNLLFSKARGMYFLPFNMTPTEIIQEQLIKGFGDFPYFIGQRYEAVENFKLFNGKQIIKDKSVHYKLSDYLNYTFGLEFEASLGYIPEDICFRDGLIPLRDGSITAPEYSTIILKGNDGISLLKQQIDTLKEYTNFNKECSLHIHFGGYPLIPDKIFKLYKVCKLLEPQLYKILPELTFFSSRYKSNGKNYCKELEIYNNFDEMYQSLVGRNFFGSFAQAHPNDIERKRKWNVQTRYFWCNFINALCYNVNKTIEFRFLRPTYNFKKILLWIYIFNGILEFSKRYYSDQRHMSLEIIIHTCYPPELAEELCFGINAIHALSINQTNNGDQIGSNVWMEDDMFNNLNI